MERRYLGRDLGLGSGEQQERVASPKMAIILSGGTLLLVRYKDTAWFGLPGGKVKEEELPENTNLLGPGAFPTLERELCEELGINLGEILPKSEFAGLAEYRLVDSLAKKAIYVLEPIFALSLDPQESQKFNHLQGNPNYFFYHLGGPPGEAVIFPSARMFISAIEGVTPERFGGWLTDRPYYFQMKPEMKLLYQAPNWLR